MTQWGWAAAGSPRPGAQVAYQTDKFSNWENVLPDANWSLCSPSCTPFLAAL